MRSSDRYRVQSGSEGVPKALSPLESGVGSRIGYRISGDPLAEISANPGAPRIRLGPEIPGNPLESRGILSNPGPQCACLEPDAERREGCQQRPEDPQAFIRYSLYFYPAGGSKRAFCEVKAEDKEVSLAHLTKCIFCSCPHNQALTIPRLATPRSIRYPDVVDYLRESDLNPEANDTSVETPNQKDPKSAGVILTLENGKLPMYAFPPEDPTEKEERLNKLNEETEMLKLENEEIIEEDKRIIASNKQVLEESKKFENRDKALEFEDRPFKSREDDPNPLSPNTIELTESVVERIVEHARFLPDDYLDARLFPTMADKRTHMQDPNYNEFVLSKIKEKAKPRVRGAELSEDEEIKLHFDVKELPELDASETRDMRERFNLDIYDNIERVLIKEKFNPSARKTQAMMRIEANELKEKEQKRTESENQSIFDYIEEETIIDWPRRVREIARKTNIRYYESHMPNGELDWRFNESLAPITEDNQ
eukprot:1320521-Amorphochlora_amoeboformis.AAC.2